ncbi:phosphoribosyltransferase [Asticcacaulis sp.]|uniref:phosphoribosyltransferase n=1 Tax=Asticcacaulis sp. TaxID=1872648 RepID=UPI002BA7F3DD|nr:phosphoribosyltransferase [Asticcacaulis sp.]HTM82073.1 phosphoribosyltransferase [Asticcacaulis sp.]
MYFRDRRDAGRQLAKPLEGFRDRRDVIVMALPRGGVPVAFEVAKILHLQLDLMLVRKLGVPGHEELAMGAIADGGVKVLIDAITRFIPEADISTIVSRELAELERRGRTYRQGRSMPVLKNRTVILIDDGCATGATMGAAIQAARKLGAARITAAIPVASQTAHALLKNLADEVICLDVPEPFRSVGMFYVHFGQTEDAEVVDLLAQAWVWDETTHVAPTPQRP